MPSEKKSLRQIMTDEIRNSGWLDYYFKFKQTKVDFAGLRLEEQAKSYVDYLNKLDDDDFLFAYNLVREVKGLLD